MCCSWALRGLKVRGWVSGPLVLQDVQGEGWGRGTRAPWNHSVPVEALQVWGWGLDGAGRCGDGPPMGVGPKAQGRVWAEVVWVELEMDIRQ